MAEYHHRGHSVTDLKYHLIWVTKCRFAVLKGDVAIRCRDLIREICQAREVSVVRGAVSPDHVHLLVSAPAILAPAKLAQYLKGSRSRRLQEEFPSLRKRSWGQPLWAASDEDEAVASAIAQTLLGPASVGAWVLLCDGGGGGREDDQTLHRRAEMGRRRGEPISHCHGQVGGGRKAFQAAFQPPHGLPVPPHPTVFRR